jgi:hydroxyacylglutathione hydrolase
MQSASGFAGWGPEGKNGILPPTRGKGETVQPSESTPIVRTVTSALFDENAYILAITGRQDCVVVDPGLEPERIVDELFDLGVKPVAILNTHGHADHIAGNAALKDRWPDIPLIIGVGDADKLTDPAGNLSAGFGLPLVSPAADRTVREGEVLDLAGIRWTVRETPGHSRGLVVFVALELQPILVLGGDVLFAGSVGRTDFPDGDGAALAASIHAKLFTLPDDTIVFPGHGPPTTTGREKQTNPYVGRGGVMLGPEV